MVIINPTHNTQPAALLRPAGPAPVLAIDRVLNAVVLGERAQHLYELASGNLRLMAESQTALRQGEQLQLRVTGRDARQRPELEILQRGASNIAPLLRGRLPQQQPLNQLMASLQHIHQAGDPALRSLLAPILETLPRRQQLFNATGVQQALRDSGQFLEASLFKGQPPERDLKAALLRLAAQLQLRQTSPQLPLAKSYGPETPTSPARPAALPDTASGGPPALPPPGKLAQHPPQAPRPLPPNTLARGEPHYSTPAKSDLPGQLHPQPRLEPTMPPAARDQLTQILGEVRGVLARQDAQQLLQLQNRDHSAVIELPVRDRDGVDVWQFQLQPPREGRDDSRAQGEPSELPPSGWSLTLNFDLPGLGPIRAVLTDRDQQLHIHFEASEASTRQLLTRHQQELRERLSAQGISDPQIDCEASPMRATTPAFSSLLDDHA